VLCELLLSLVRILTSEGLESWRNNSRSIVRFHMRWLDRVERGWVLIFGTRKSNYFGCALLLWDIAY
jgi:hypothetical protein